MIRLSKGTDDSGTGVGRLPAGQIPIDSPTEQRNLTTITIDTVSTREALAMIHAEDTRVIGAVSAVIDCVAELVDVAVERVRRGGQVHYFGAGTSGRLAVLDAAELLPTYGTDSIVLAHHAGGIEALIVAAENVEDRAADGAREAATLGPDDIAIGLTASGRTPYVAGALRAARRAGAATALITANPHPKLADAADIIVAADTGPEVITGSTRMKAGTAEKLILNAFSTVLMVKLGKVYSNLMIGMRPTNAKLRGRSISMLIQATGRDADQCKRALQACGDIPTALVLLLVGSTLERESVYAARQALTDAGGRVADAVAALRPAT